MQPFLNLSETGTSHGAAEHNFTHAYQIMAICEACRHGLLEKYSHDCFQYHGDEDWDMYWWYALDPIALGRLRELLTACPDPLNAACACAPHRSLRDSSERLWGGVQHAVDPAGKIAFTWMVLDEQPDQITLKFNAQRGFGQAA